MKDIKTDWKKEFHKLQAKVNVMEVRMYAWKETAKRFQALLRIAGWGCMIISFFIASFDVIAGAFSGSTLWSFSYNNNFGLGQILSLIFFGGTGLILLVAGYYKVR